MGRSFWIGAGILSLAAAAVVLSSTWVQFRSCEVVSADMAGAYATQTQSACQRVVTIHWGAVAACVLGGLLVIGAFIAPPRK
jgi:hypothetical protein